MFGTAGRRCDMLRAMNEAPAEQPYPDLNKDLWVLPPQSGPSTWSGSALDDEVNELIDYLYVLKPPADRPAESGDSCMTEEVDAEVEKLAATMTAYLLEGVAQGRLTERSITDLAAGRPARSWYDPVEDELLVWRPTVGVEALEHYASHPNDLIRESARQVWAQRLAETDADQAASDADDPPPAVADARIADFELVARTTCYAYLRMRP
jgi:hypothetical protein